MGGDRRFLLGTCAVLGAVAVWSAIRPYDLVTWVSETFPALLGLGLLAATHRRFPLTRVTYVFVAVFCIVLFVGGHYTYERVPLGNWVRDAFGFQRNHFDRFGHFLQGFTPALIAREMLLRLAGVRRGGWLFFLVCSVCLAISACYEIFEWLYAVALGGDHATDFLGSQGDPWDAQWDMFLALLGAASAQIALGRLQDRQLARASA